MFGRMMLLLALLALAVSLAGCGGNKNPYDDPEVIKARARAEVARQQTEQARIDAEARIQAARAAEEAKWQGKAELAQAEGEADAERERAETEQAERLAASRQMERDAAAQRFYQTVPVLLLILFPLCVLAFGLVWLLTRRAPAGQVDPAVLLLLQAQHRAQLEREREFYHALAMTQRRSLPADRRVVVIPDDWR